jgi:uncharacterized protein with HEPN domain
MLDSANKIQEYTKDYSFEDFIDDNKTIDAVVRNFEIIVKRLTELTLIFKLKIHKFPGKN